MLRSELTRKPAQSYGLICPPKLEDSQRRQTVHTQLGVLRLRGFPGVCLYTTSTAPTYYSKIPRPEAPYRAAGGGSPLPMSRIRVGPGRRDRR